MRHYRVEGRFSAFLVVLHLFGFAAFASEPTEIPPGAKWDKPAIVLSLSRSISSAPNIQGNLPEVLRRSLSKWSSVADLRFEIVETDARSVSAKGPRGDGVSLLSSAATPENVRLFPDESSSPAAVTRIFRDSRGTITEADIILNPFARFSTDGTFDTFDLEDTLTHEVGHLLGLGHSPIWGSLMYARGVRSVGPSSYYGPRRNPAAVDAASIRALYGPEAESSLICCESIRGRISGVAKISEQLVWLEDRTTGRVVGASTVANDGTYRIEGVPEGSFRIITSNTAGDGINTTGQSEVIVELGSETNADISVRSLAPEFRPVLIGTSPHLSRLPLRLANIMPTIYIGAFGIRQSVLRLIVSTKPLSFELIPDLAYSGSRGMSVFALRAFTIEDLANGEYTLVIEDSAGVKQYFPGVLIVD